jgi:hypothetical protein
MYKYNAKIDRYIALCMNCLHAAKSKGYQDTGLEDIFSSFRPVQYAAMLKTGSPIDALFSCCQELGEETKSVIQQVLQHFYISCPL